jgi:hypothetical protein
VYIDSTMGHAYVLPKGHDEALVLGVCASAEEDLAESLMNLHAEAPPAARPKTAPAKRLAAKR